MMKKAAGWKRLREPARCWSCGFPMRAGEFAFFSHKRARPYCGPTHHWKGEQEIASVDPRSGFTFTYRGHTFTTAATNPTNKEKVEAILERFPEGTAYAWAWVEGRA